MLPICTSHISGLLRPNRLTDGITDFVNDLQTDEGPKSAKEYFEIDFAGFSDFAEDVDGPPVWHTCNWERNTDVSDGIEIPSGLLAGPWTDDMIKHLFWLVKSGAEIDWVNSTLGEVSSQDTD